MTISTSTDVYNGYYSNDYSWGLGSKTVTTTVKEYDKEGRVIKETTTVETVPVTRQPYQVYNTYTASANVPLYATN